MQRVKIGGPNAPSPSVLAPAAAHGVLRAEPAMVPGENEHDRPRPLLSDRVTSIGI